ncbi:putative Uncharacterized membrane protein [Beijerinckiaceae bacterium RH AL1]|nr:putative Uncharacterized membrane protein [Beijerinckiaceae bacterium RH CH11]VVB46741.1 putative Uncharacterized membrane protein [Beijerinckiaceae bacterium RH AL8]VVC55485.1 putative Uncharacterized membrane protein [Beijerinckiaceae bacterium RH AL1]
MSDVSLDRVPKTPGRTLFLMTIGWLLVAVGWAIPALVVAGLGSRNAPEHTRDNYSYMVRTLLIGLLYATPSVILHWVGSPIALVSVLATAVTFWKVARCLNGLIALARNRPLADPQTWLV